MSLQELVPHRMRSQLIGTNANMTPAEVVGHMGAMQAQDFLMAKWAVGLRLPGSSAEMFDSAFNAGEILRTHLMRPTWHFIAADDIHWLLELTAPKIRSSLGGRHRNLEITGKILLKSKALIEKALLKETFLTRDELAGVFVNAGIRTDGNRLSHLMLCAELDGLVCSGPLKGGKQTYKLLQEHVPRKRIFTRDESMAKLADRYFRSHGPATVQDFTWWSGLNTGDAKRALEMVRHSFLSEEYSSGQYWFSGDMAAKNPEDKTSLYLLPAFDEFLIGYRSRDAVLSLIHNKKVISDNGIFRPVILLNGQVAGLWRRTTKKEQIVFETELFTKDSGKIRSMLKHACEDYSRFLGKKLK